MKLCMTGCRGHFIYVFWALKDIPELTLSGICSGCEDPVDPLRQFSKEAGFSPKEYDDWRKMLDVEKPDILCVAGPFHKHAEIILEAMQRGIHIFCEKPLTLTLADLAKVEEGLKKYPVKIMPMVGLRYEAPFYELGKQIHAGAIGKVKMIQGRKSYRLGTRPFFYKERALYGGTIPWVGSHAVDWMIAFGGTDFESAFAYHNREDNFGNGDMEIAGMAQFRFKSGVMAGMTVDFLRPAAAPTHGDDRVRVVGTEGVLEVAREELWIIDKDGERKLSVPEPDRKLFSDFVFDVMGKRKALVQTTDGLLLTKACLLAREAADTGKVQYF